MNPVLQMRNLPKVAQQVTVRGSTRSQGLTPESRFSTLNRRFGPRPAGGSQSAAVTEDDLQGKPQPEGHRRELVQRDAADRPLGKGRARSWYLCPRFPRRAVAPRDPSGQGEGPSPAARNTRKAEDSEVAGRWANGGQRHFRSPSEHRSPATRSHGKEEGDPS
ncbi:uncharacterized protein LOC116269977 [Papio anubis]|uniref:uncharacterized protein LOC116269977 n=1 Tax=Papio anubis TaxID=9555 RepID=UPI0012AEAEC7|nr:uncharacterized protein LOC116269977 [Papio anubis]